MDIVIFGNHDYRDNDDDDGTKPKQILTRKDKAGFPKTVKNPNNKPENPKAFTLTLALTLTLTPNPNRAWFSSIGNKLGIGMA